MSQATIQATAHMSETPMRGDADERAALLTMPAGAVNEEVRAATEESIGSREINVDNPRGR